MQTDEFETEEPTATYTPEQWSTEECAWMLTIAERPGMSLAERRANEEQAQCA